MALYLPGTTGLLAVVVTWGVGAVLLLLGGAVVGRRAAAEYRIGAGWGALCLVLTAWAVFVPLSLRLPAVAAVVAALAALLAPSRRLGRDDAVALGRLLLVSLPLWVVMAGVRPSQVDTFLNLLPNADYLVDYGRLPTAALPPSHSYLPAAPYDTQFLAFLGSLVWRDYPAAGMSLVNVMLRLVGGLAIARFLARPGSTPSWGTTALGLLLVTLFDPGFVPRFHFSAYGETALAVTALLAACLFIEVQEGRRRQFALALILAAMINTKQSGIGLVLAVAGAAVVVALAERRGNGRRAVAETALVLVPAALLYLVWRWFVAHAGVAELEPLPLNEWNWARLPATFEGIVGSIAEKPIYFAAEVTAFVLLAILLRREGWTRTTRLLGFNAAAFVLYNGFLVATYIAHFSAEMAVEAHSYFRYNTHLSLILVLSLALAACDLARPLWARQGGRRGIAAAAVLLALAAPVAFAERLRFDIEMPQPLVWDLAAALKPHLADGDRLALLLPGDNGEVGDLLASYLASAPPRRRGLDITRFGSADSAALDSAAAAGDALAVVSCTPAGLLGLPAGQAALLRREPDSGWQVAAAWPYRTDLKLSRWQRNRHWPALCR
ncbi:MAG TPA: hypothetical protein VMB84_19735 [Stellaceae bacterium]|nr:hypothetical protein [Stellaceae bacterium]